MQPNFNEHTSLFVISEQDNVGKLSKPTCVYLIHPFPVVKQLEWYY